jgi:ADP-ribose pyrophosphatase
MNFTEKLHKTRRIYAGRSVNFHADEIILPDGKKGVREYIDHPGAVAVLAFADARNIVLVKQYRFPVGELTWEIPAGKLDKGEDIRACARRELVEETGFRARSVKKVLSYWPTPAFSNELLHVFVARGLVPAVKSPDEDEFIDHRIVPFDRALAWVRTGRIRDSKTVIALLFWAALGARR